MFVPLKEKETVKNAMFEAGAGVQGSYECCSFESCGNGQFRPLKGSNPTIGTHDKLEVLEEVRVEMLCDPSALKAVIIAIKRAHPYEEPAIDIIKTLALDEFE